MIRITRTTAIARSLQAVNMTALRHRSSSLCLQRRTIPCHIQLSAFSSQSSTNANANNSQNNRVPIALYRQLLSWCRKYDNVPFNPLPPVTLSPPQVNPLALRRLKGMRSFLDSNEIKAHDEVRVRPYHDGISRFGKSSGRHPHPAHCALYKENVAVKENMITFPEIRDANELKAIIRSIYWLNNTHTIEHVEGIATNTTTTSEEELRGEGTKEQITLAFDAMKSCNQLSSSELDRRCAKREFNIKVRQQQHSSESESESVELKFPIVEYNVGQVVKHKSKLWRGVIVGWNIEEDKKEDDRLTSLTTKQYSLSQLNTNKEEGDGSSVGSNTDTQQDTSLLKYTVLVDHIDLKDSQNNRFESDEGSLLGNSLTVESQEDLSPVDDPFLQRIHNHLIKEYFTKFDARGHFVPNDILSYVYPLDRFSHSKYGDANDTDTTIGEAISNVESISSTDLEKSRLAICNGVREIGRRLLLPLSESNQQQSENDEASLLVSSLISSVQSMLMENNTSSPNQLDSAISSLAKLYMLHVKINSLTWFRNANLPQKEHIQFSLGQVVKHKLYGFRGVVAAWDAKPRMDVSNWDGLQGVENPNEKPFYHIYPDVNDCIEAFGGPRSFRYVCQDNLELSSSNKNPLELKLDVDPEEWKWDGEKGNYIASAEMKFMYAEDLGEDETTLIATVRNLRKILTECLLEIRDGDNPDLFTMDDLFCQLQFGANNVEDAVVIQDLIKELWKESSNVDLRSRIDNGIADLLDGKHESALDTFSTIVTSDPLYGEAWNKKATVHYMMGEKDDSIKAAKEALKIDHRNFQALAGIGLIEMDSFHYDKAESAFRKCLAINPWLSTVSSRLSVCVSKKEKGSE